MPRVAVFDSGVGGLSIHAQLRSCLPGIEYHFVSDNAAHPYGTKAAEQLIPRVESVIERIITELDPDLIVIACNTASTVALPSLRNKHPLPFVGVVPAIKPAAAHSANKSIAILGTPATVEREYTQQLIDQFAADCEVLKIGSSKLVELAESKLRGHGVDMLALERELAPILSSSSCDTVVLACTHFPLLLSEIKTVCGTRDLTFIDSASAIARRVAELLAKRISDGEDPVGNSVERSMSWMTRDITQHTELLAALNDRDLPYAGILIL